MMNFICRETVLEILEQHEAGSVLTSHIKAIPSFPAPNPQELNGRNVMGQTEDEFWRLVDAQT